MNKATEAFSLLLPLILKHYKSINSYSAIKQQEHDDIIALSKLICSSIDISVNLRV